MSGHRETSTPVSEPSRAAIEAAAAWYVHLSEAAPTPQERASFHDWYGAAEENALAWQRIEALWGHLGRAALPGARAAVERAWGEERRTLRRGVGGTATGCVLLAVGGALAWLAAGLGAPGHLLADYHTASGERRSVTLADGSRLTLNTASAVDVTFTPDRRHIRLHAGEIAIRVATDPSRALTVVTADGRARALGTRFTVRRDETGSRPVTRVTVRESEVALCPAEAARRACRVIGAGERAATAGQEVINRASVAPSAAAAWREGNLVLDDRPLPEVLAELDRYRTGHLAYDASALADVRISGVLPIDDTDRALDALAQDRPIRVRSYGPWWTSVSRAD